MDSSSFWQTTVAQLARHRLLVYETCTSLQGSSLTERSGRRSSGTSASAPADGTTIKSPHSISWVCTRARWNPATCGINQEAGKTQFGPAMRAGGREGTRPIHSEKVRKGESCSRRYFLAQNRNQIYSETSCFVILTWNLAWRENHSRFSSLSFWHSLTSLESPIHRCLESLMPPPGLIPL